MSETNIPDEARERERKWWVAIGWTDGAERHRAVMALADAEVAAERQRLHDRIEAWPEVLRSAMREYGDRPADLAARWLKLHVDRLVSPVSDDIGGTKP